MLRNDSAASLRMARSRLYTAINVGGLMPETCGVCAVIPKQGFVFVTLGPRVSLRSPEGNSFSKALRA